jgi:hypothetical protein
MPDYFAVQTIVGEGEKDGYCLVRNAEDGEWYMGVRLGEDAIVCWASYGASLEDAIDAL